MAVKFLEYRLTQVNVATSVIVTVIIIMIAVCAEQETGLSNVVRKHSLQTAGLQWGSEKDSAGSVWGEGGAEGRVPSQGSLAELQAAPSTPEQRIHSSQNASQSGYLHSY